MGFFNSLFRGILTLAELGVWVYIFLMVSNGIMAMVNVVSDKPFPQMVHKLTDPLLNWMRVQFPKLKQDGIDFSPWAVILLLIVIKLLIINPLYFATFTPRAH